MGKEQIYSIEKKELSGLIAGMTLENLCDTLDTIQAHIDLLRCLDKVEYKTSDCNDETETGTETGTETRIETDHKVIKQPILQEGWGQDRKYYLGVFHRNLRGGTIGAEEIYVPESVVRSLGLESLDWVKAVLISSSYGKGRYEYICMEKHQAGCADKLEKDIRNVIEYGIVQYEETLKSYYISAKTEMSELPHKIILVNGDVIRFKIEKGDIIEYAYWNDDIMHGKIVWKHPQKTLDFLKKGINKTEKDTSGTLKKTETKKRAKRMLKPSLNNYTICMVGGANRNLQRGIKEEVERRKGVFIFCSGDEPKNTLESRIKKADFVVVYTESISHDSMYYTKAVCKKHQIMVSYTKNLGNAQFIARINLLIKKRENDAKLREQQQTTA